MELRNWQDVDKAIGQLASVGLEIARKQAEIGQKIYEILEENREELQLLNAKKQSIEKAIEYFCMKNKEAFLKKRSRNFMFGRIAWKLSEEIVIPKQIKDSIIKTIKQLGYHDCIRIKEEIDKTALKRLDDRELVKLGIKKVKKDNFRIEADIQTLAETEGISIPEVVVDMEKLSKAIKDGK